MRLVFGTCLLAMFTLLPASAQIYPGQYPPGGGQYPPGQYPPGQDPTNPNAPPNSGGGLSIPRRHKKSDKNADVNLNTIAADGFVLKSDDKKLVVVVDDE